MGYDPVGTGVFFVDCDSSYVSPAAIYRLKAVVDNEPGVQRQVYLTSYLEPEAKKVHEVAIEAAVDPLTNVLTTEKDSSLNVADQKFRPVEYYFTVRNEGNEFDDLSVSLASASAGYVESLEWVSSPIGKTCKFSDAAPHRSYTCQDMGAYDEMNFKLVVTPDGNHRDIYPGAADLVHTVVVVSQDDGSKSDGLTFRTSLVGDARFDTTAVVTARDAHAGQEVSMPFQVDNVGNRDDTYSIVVVDGDSAWRPRLSVDDQVFVPGEHTLDAFLRVQAPEDAEVGDRGEFTVRVDSSNPDLGFDELNFAVTVIADGGLVVQGEGGENTVLIEGRGQPQSVTVEAVTLDATVGDPVTLRVDRDKLPGGWAVTSSLETAAFEAFSGGYRATVSFEVTSPDEALGTSSVPLIVDACLGEQADCIDGTVDYTASGDIVMNLQDDVGVFLKLDDPDTITATLPGGDVVFPVRVQNAGLSADVIELSATEVPAGWSISFDPPAVTLGPLETRVIDVIVSSPVDAAPGDAVNFLFFATSSVDASAFDQLELTASIGEFGLEWSASDEVEYAAPGDFTVLVVTVWNNGTLPDAVVATPGLGTDEAVAAYGSLVDVRVEPSAFELAPGENKDVRVFVDFGPAVPAKVALPIKVDFASIPDDPTTITATFDLEVLDYVSADVDRDGIREYAIDRNRDRSDGFEEFREGDASSGVSTRPAQLVRFLSDEGRLRHTVRVASDGETVDAVVLVVDGDPGVDGFGDRKRDHMLDDDGDGLPDLYWDPDDGHSYEIEFFKDIDADGVPDYFLDTSGNNEVNAVYDLADGTFVALLVRDVDNDGTPDYVVDKNGNGVVDGDETVLFTRDGKLIQVTKVDVDGDGQLDDVFDYDGDGVPDSFIPAGKTKGVDITVDRDLNDDGFLDWTYDANRDGKDDHFYDPAAQTGGHEIDTQAEFLSSLKNYWYVGALFVLVAALFVVLVAVTRR